MKPDVLTWLEDIERSIDEIFEFLPDKSNYLTFEPNLLVRKAVERNIEIIGEAVSRILKVEPEIKISDSRKIVDTRNRIIHGYDNVTPDILWLIINRYLPVLLTEVKILLK